MGRANDTGWGESLKHKHTHASEATNNTGKIHQEKNKLEHAPLLSEKKRNENRGLANNYVPNLNCGGERVVGGLCFFRDKKTIMGTEKDTAFYYRPYLGQFLAGTGIKI